MKPVIGIAAGHISGEEARFAVLSDYIRSVECAGGLPVLFPATENSAQDAAQWARMCDGILLAGGGDVAPVFYGQSPLPQMGGTDRRRDRAEIALCREAVQCGKPVLGICRGLQVMNVAYGGTLWQDIPSQLPQAICHCQKNTPKDELFHSISIAPDSLLAKIMGGSAHECNTYHHQAVKEPAQNFTASACAPDGVIEALEHENGRMLGVQWHPERLAEKYAAHAAIFSWLVTLAAEK